jgi:uncharacterized protein (TIGR02453 family)
MIPSNTFEFLRDLQQHNNREWFHANKKRYDKLKAEFEEFIAQLIVGYGQFENMAGVAVKDCNYRIARDVRFSANKDPYKTWLSASFSEGGRKSGRMDYYLHIQEGGQSFLGGGMYAPTPQHLANLRQEIDYNANELKNIIYNPEFVEIYPTVWGNSVKTAPKGYSKDHPEIELLKRNQLFFMHHYTDKEVLEADFAEKVLVHSKVLKPYLDFLNYVFFDYEEPEVF